FLFFEKSAWQLGCLVALELASSLCFLWWRKMGQCPPSRLLEPSQLSAIDSNGCCRRLGLCRRRIPLGSGHCRHVFYPRDHRVINLGPIAFAQQVPGYVGGHPFDGDAILSHSRDFPIFRHSLGLFLSRLLCRRGVLRSGARSIVQVSCLSRGAG